MADTKVTEGTCVIPMFERNRYFAGKPMMVGDFDAEQQYVIGKNRLQNRLIHGAGIICGLRLSNPRIIDSKLIVEISEGAALDCCGNLIAVNAPAKVEVQADSGLAEATLGEGNYYLYLRFSECIRQPIMAHTNASSCEEVCCYNRIRETFEIVLSTRGPSAGFFFTGTVTTSDGETPIVGAKVRALQQQVVKAETLTDNSGAFRLGVPVDVAAYDIDASATGFTPAVSPNQSIPAGQKELRLVPNFALAAKAGAGTAPDAVCDELVQNYFEGHSLTCVGCDAPRVFLGVVNINGTVSINQNSSETRENRAVVYTNPMLHDLFCDHVSDFNNPHRTTAEQIRALQSVNNVGNVSGARYVSNIDLASEDATIDVTPDPNNRRIGLQLAANAVKPKHLNEDTINDLLISSDSSILIQPNTVAKSIAIMTNPATSVTSVGTAKFIGISKKPAPEDHVHDLGDGVVTKPKLGEDVISTLLVSDDTITITPNVVKRQISIKTNRATQVSSVGKEKRVGASPNFSPEDHQHNIQINDRVPDVEGSFLLTAGDNVEIKSRAENELVFSARTSRPFTTGIVRFEGVGISESRNSTAIRNGLNTNNVAIVLGLIQEDLVLIKDLGRNIESPPVIVAEQVRNKDTFQIGIRDTRTEGKATTYIVRWWAIPSLDEMNEMETVVSQPRLQLGPE